MGLQLNCTSCGSVLQLGQVEGGPCASGNFCKKGWVSIPHCNVPLDSFERNIILGLLPSLLIIDKVNCLCELLLCGQLT